jgi:hypothetical protein
LDVTPDLWIPLQLNANSTSHGPSLIAVGRLRPGVSLALAQADADLTAEAFRRLYPQVIGPTDTFTVAPWRVLSFALAVSVATALLSQWLPAVVRTPQHRQQLAPGFRDRQTRSYAGRDRLP